MVRTIINMTGHPLTLIQWDGSKVVLESAGQLRVYSNVEEVGMLDIMSVTVPLLEIVEQTVRLPDPKPDTLFVVSGIVAAKARRPDLVVPSRIVRDDSGKAIGCRALARVRLS